MLPNLKAFIAIFEPINHFKKITYQVDWCIEASLDHSEFYTFLEAPPRSKSRLQAHTVIPEMHKSGYFHILWCNKNYSCTEWLNECNIHFTLSTYIKIGTITDINYGVFSGVWPNLIHEQNLLISNHENNCQNWTEPIALKMAIVYL